MILHRLRLLSFSKSVFSIKTPKLSNIKEAEESKVNQEKTEVVLKVDSDTKILLQEDQNIESKKKQENTTICMKPCTDFVENQAELKTRKTKHCIKLKSDSETLKILPKKKKSRTTRKTLSLGDLKKRFSQKNLEYSNRIKQTFQALRKQKIGKRNKKKSNELELKNLPFADSNSKHQKRRRSSKRQSRPHLCKSSDIFGFYRNTRLIDPYTYYQRYSKIDPLQALIQRSAKKKKKLSKVYTNCPYNHHPLKFVTSSKSWGSESGGRNCTNPLHYNLVNFPQSSKSSMCQKQSLRLHRRDAMTSNYDACYLVSNTPGDKKHCSPSKVHVASHSSPLKVPRTSVDKAVPTCKFEKKANTPIEIKSNAAVCTQQPKCSMSQQKSELSKRRVPLTMLYSKIYHKMLHRNSSRTIVKYILLSLVLIAWSPFIIAIGVGWILTYPLRPRHVISANNRRNYKCSKDLNHNKISFKGLTRRIAKSMYSAGCTIISLIRPKKHCKPEGTLKCSSHPDPKRKYTLFHANGRGWVLKPVRDTKPLGSESQKHNKFIQNIQNLFCDCDHKPDLRKTSTRANIKAKPTKNVMDKTHSCHMRRPTKDPCHSVPHRTALKGRPRNKANSDTIGKRDCACQSPAALVCGKLKQSAAAGDVLQRQSNVSSPIPSCLNKGISNLNCLKEFYSPKQQPFSCRRLITKRSRSEVNLHRPDPELVNLKSVRSRSVPKAKESSAKVTTRGRLTKSTHAERPSNIEDRPSILRKSGSPELDPKSVRSYSESKAKESSAKVTTRGRVTKSGHTERPAKVENRASILKKSECPELCQTKSALSPSKQCSARVTTRCRSTKLKQAEVPEAFKAAASTGKAVDCQPKKNTRRKAGAKVSSKPSPGGARKQVPKKGKESRKGRKPVKKQRKRTDSCGRRFWDWLRNSICGYLDPMDDPDKGYCPFNPKCVCRDLYLVTLRYRPWFWVYRCCPSQYPVFLRWYYCSKQFFYHAMCCLSLCLWTPIICWCYFCYKLLSCCC